MKVLVLIKEVPDMATVKFDSEKGVVNRAGADAEINPFDENALQTAINLKRKYRDIEITVLTMGPPRAEKSLRMAYAKGADKLVLLTDREFGGSDTYATAKIISAAIKENDDYDVILCGEKSVDGDTAQVGAEVAEFLGIPHSYYVDSIELNHGEKRVKVSVENICGKRQERIMVCPCLISVTKNAARPELPTVARKLESLNAEVKVLCMADISELSAANTGFSGSPTKVKKVVVPRIVTRNSYILRDDIDKFAGILSGVLSEKGLV